MNRYNWTKHPLALRALSLMGPAYNRTPGQRCAGRVPRMSSVDTLENFARQGLEAAGPGSWYSAAAASILSKAGGDRSEARYLAALCAAFSPRVQVVKANRMALQYYRGEGYDAGAMPVHTLLATRAREAHERGEDPVLALAAPKVGPFAAALCGRPEALVLDVWMARALGVPEEGVTRPATAQKAAERLALVSERLGISLADTQAAVWLGSALASGRSLPSLGWRW